MLAALSVSSLCAGAVIAGYAPRVGARAATFESCGAALFLCGLVLLGACLPVFR